MVIVVGVAAASVVVGLSLIQSNRIDPEESSAAVVVPSTCKKLGINLAWVGPNAESEFTRAQSNSMGYYLEMATSPSQSWGLGQESMPRAFTRGIVPIIRICYGSHCNFNNPQTYVDFLNQLGDIVGPNNTFFAIAGPNEPMSENWLGGAQGDFNVIGPKVADYMNAVIDGVDRSNVKLLSPVFNLTHPSFEQLVDKMRSSGARFGDLDGIAGNAYNLKGYSLGEEITDFVVRLRGAGFQNDDIYLTEIGMFESERNPGWTGTKVPHDLAKTRLAEEIRLMKLDGKVKAYLLFNSFGTNPDPNFVYNHLSDAELNPGIIGAECDPNQPTPTNTPTPTSTPIPSTTPGETATPTPTLTLAPTVTNTPTPTVSTSPTPTNCPALQICAVGYQIVCTPVVGGCPTCACIAITPTVCPTPPVCEEGETLISTPIVGACPGYACVPIPTPTPCPPPPGCKPNEVLIHGDPLDASCPAYKCLPIGPSATPTPTVTLTVTPSVSPTLTVTPTPTLTPTPILRPGRIVNVCGDSTAINDIPNWDEHEQNPLCNGCRESGTCQGSIVKVFHCTEEARENGGVTCEGILMAMGSFIRFNDVFRDRCSIYRANVYNAEGVLKDFVVWRGDSVGTARCIPKPPPSPTPTTTKPPAVTVTPLPRPTPPHRENGNFANVCGVVIDQGGRVDWNKHQQQCIGCYKDAYCTGPSVAVHECSQNETTLDSNGKIACLSNQIFTGTFVTFDNVLTDACKVYQITIYNKAHDVQDYVIWQGKDVGTNVCDEEPSEEQPEPTVEPVPTDVVVTPTFDVPEPQPIDEEESIIIQILNQILEIIRDLLGLNNPDT